VKKNSLHYLLVAIAATMVSAGTLTQAQELPTAPQPQYVASIVGSENARGAAIPDGTVSVSTLKAEGSLPGGTVSVSALMAEAERNPHPAAHRFFDCTSWLLTGVETSAMLADGITTHNRLGQLQTRLVNVNGVQTPVGRLFVNHGWAGMAAGGALNLGADMGIRYLLHKTGHHKLERIVPLAFAASSTFAAAHNTVY
jgi:hypothetical protein